ncbi:MAG: 7TM-DISM domain-containing protein [Flavobacteriales bacterium]
MALALSCSLVSIAQDGPLVRVQDFGKSSHIGKHLEILEDPNSEMLVEDAILSTGFIASGNDVPNLGITTSAFWLRAKSEERHRRKFRFPDLEHAEVEHVDVFVRTNGGKPTIIASTGQMRADLHEDGHAA